MINTEQQKNQNDITHSSPQKTSHKVREISQLRRAKMHVSCFIGDIDHKGALTPNLRELLEASLILQTISAKVLAAHLHRSPATIRIEFQQIIAILGNHDIHSASCTTKDENFMYLKVSNGKNKLFC